MRFCYLDESGVGKKTAEPEVIVAGILLNVDTQYGPLSEYLYDMANNFIGSHRPSDFCFHAKHLFHGGKSYPLDKWSPENRRSILGHLLDIPKLFKLPVFFSRVDRSLVASQDPNRNNAARRDTETIHASAVLTCCSTVDHWVSTHLPHERVFFVHEDHPRDKKRVSTGIRVFGDRGAQLASKQHPQLDRLLLKKLVDEPHYVEKSGSSPLQVADACAFVLRRYFGGYADAHPYVERFASQIACQNVVEYVGSADGNVPTPIWTRIHPQTC